MSSCQSVSGPQVGLVAALWVVEVLLRVLPACPGLERDVDRRRLLALPVFHHPAGHHVPVATIS